MTPTLLVIWTIAGAAGAAGVGVLVAGALASAAGLGVRVPRVGEVGGRCPSCGYCTDGLEEPICPECGGGFGAEGARQERRRRWGACVLGAGLMMAGLLGFPASEAAALGVAHALPTPALIGAVAWWPASGRAAVEELQMRADSGLMRAWERRASAWACASAMAGSGEPAARRGAAWLMIRVAREAEVGMLDAMLQDADAVVRADGAEAMGRRDPADDAPGARLAALASSDRCATVRRRAIDSMLQRRDTGRKAREALTLAASDPDESVRQRALIALTIGTGDDLAALAAAVRAATDASESIRLTAVWALGQLAGDRREAMGALARALHDSSPLVRASAAWGLGAMRGRACESLGRLAALAIEDEDGLVRTTARMAIERIGG
jgi:HEAT repeat protein